MKRINLFDGLALGCLLLLLIAYSNHFQNSFHFDDDHSIVNNAFIRDLRNIPHFFKTAATFSSLPMNQTYRPMLTTLYAIDYHFGGMNTVFFHLPIFIFYILQGILMYLIILRIFDYSYPSPANKYFALFGCTWYMLNTANADVINYISASSDSISTFWVVAAMALYMYYPKLRTKYIYLLPVAVGALFKQPALVFPGLLAVYYFLFESAPQQTSPLNGKDLWKRIKKTFIAALPSLLLCAALYELQAKLTSSTYVTGGSFYNYIITQPFVTLHYFFTFFVPVGLTADTDWVAFTSLSDYRFWIGILFLAALCYLIFKLLPHKKFAPVVFGLAWFLIALLPSALVPLSEVMNDYRAFFPYVGLVLAVAWMFYLVWEKWGSAKGEYTRLIAVFMILIVVCNAFGTHARNKVWSTEETLWYDVTQKSPDNARGMMNYGLTQMNKGNYPVAEQYFLKTAQLIPYYPYVYANLGILKAALKKNDEAEAYFQKAMLYGYNVPAVTYFYAKFLHNTGKDDKALEILKQTIKMAPADVDSRYLAMEIYQGEEDWQDLNTTAREVLALLPDDELAKNYLASSVGKKSKLENALAAVQQSPTPDNYVNLSLLYFNQKEYEKCIEACNEAIKIDPKNKIAYNNMGSAYNAMGEWGEAEKAFKNALDIDRDFQLAKNNYANAIIQKKIDDSIKNMLKKKPAPETYINLSLFYYRQGLYAKAADACNEALKLNPSYLLAYNNLCAIYNNMQQWDNAIAAGEKAVQLDPNNQLAKNNLATARQGKATSGK